MDVNSCVGDGVGVGVGASVKSGVGGLLVALAALVSLFALSLCLPASCGSMGRAEYWQNTARGFVSLKLRALHRPIQLESSHGVQWSPLTYVGLYAYIYMKKIIAGRVGG